MVQVHPLPLMFFLERSLKHMDRKFSDPTTGKTITLTTLKLLNTLRDICYNEARNKGFHSEDENLDNLSDFGDYMANLHGEASELWEAYRKNNLFEPCDKAEEMEAHQLEPLTAAEEELADILIRTFDTAARLQTDLAKAVYNKLLYNRTREFRHGNKLA